MLGSLGEVLFSPIIANKGCWDWTEAWAHLPIPFSPTRIIPVRLLKHYAPSVWTLIIRQP